MRWTEPLSPDERRLVDRLLSRVPPTLGNAYWREPEAAKAESLPCDPTATTLEADRNQSAIFATGALVAAIIEKLDSQTVREAEQAHFFALSANMEHQVAACEWFIAQSAFGNATESRHH